jgi:hypothetical protein
MVDNPSDHMSRWSAAHHLGPNVKQWILLKLDDVSVVSECSAPLCTYILMGGQKV